MRVWWCLEGAHPLDGFKKGSEGNLEYTPNVPGAYAHFMLCVRSTPLRSPVMYIVHFSSLSPIRIMPQTHNYCCCTFWSAVKRRKFYAVKFSLLPFRVSWRVKNFLSHSLNIILIVALTRLMCERTSTPKICHFGENFSLSPTQRRSNCEGGAFSLSKSSLNSLLALFSNL